MSKIIRKGAPTTKTPGTLGQEYYDGETGKSYICTKVAIKPGDRTGEADGVYTWEEEGGASSWSDLGEQVTSVVELDETLYFDSYEGWYYRSFVSGSPALGNTYAVSVNNGSVQEYVLGEEFESTWYTYTDSTTGKVYNVHFGIGWVGGIALYVEDADTYDPINVKVIQPNARIITKIDDKYLPDWVSEAKDTADSAYSTSISARTTANNAMTKSNPSGTGSFSMNRKSGSTSGAKSVAVGNKCEASGASSFAEGSGTTASGSWSHAEGCDTTASGTASHAEGHDTTASGTASHAEGYDTEASGFYAHAEGRETVASDYYTHAEGKTTIASGSVSHAEGELTQATSDASAVASTTTIKTAGYCSHAEGYGTVARGVASHAEGNGTTASGNFSHAEGRETTASGSCSHAEGYATVARAEYARAAGYECQATLMGAYAEGYRTTAKAMYAHADGIGTIAASMSQYVHGKYNIEDSSQTYAYIVGNGSSETERSNAHTLDWSGNAWYAGTVEGTAMILSSPNGTRFKITVSDSGTLSATQITE